MLDLLLFIGSLLAWGRWYLSDLPIDGFLTCDLRRHLGSLGFPVVVDTQGKVWECWARNSLHNLAQNINTLGHPYTFSAGVFGRP